MEQTATPSLRTLIANALDRRLDRVRVALPGRVVAYDAERQAVEVQPLVADVYDDDGERKVEPLPILLDVPLMFPGAGAYRITWPVDVGSTVLLVMSSSSIMNWKVSKGVDVVDPLGEHHWHHMEDAIAIPGLHPFGAVPTEAPEDALVIHGPAIRLGAAAADPIVRRSDLVAALAAVDERLASHGHGGVATGSGTSGTPSGGTPTALTPIDVPSCSPTVTSE